MRLNILAFAAGVLGLQMQPELPAWAPLAAGGLLLAMPAGYWRSWPVKMLALAGCFALGLAWASWRADSRLADQLDAAGEGQDVEVVGVVASLPQDFSHGTRFEFDLNFGQKNGPTVAFAVPQRVMLSWYQGRRDDEQFDRQPVRPGEEWRFTVRLKRPHGNANPGGFDYEAWLLERNIRATGYVRPGPGERLDSMVWRLGYVVERLRDAVRSRFFAALPVERYPQVGILVALAVGDQKAVNVESQN